MLWQLVRKMYESLLKWRATDYAHYLQQRSKWHFKKDDVKLGLVLLQNLLAPPCKWDDNLTRVVTIKTANSEFKPPISKICLLPVDVNGTDDLSHATAGGTTN